MSAETQLDALAIFSHPDDAELTMAGTLLKLKSLGYRTGALDMTARQLGLSVFFLGIIVLPFVGNAAEYFAAIYFARQDRMDLVMTVSVGSSIQIALLTAPVLVLVSYALGHPMNLVFSNPLELMAIAGSAFAVNSIALDGETTWFEGVMLVAVYALLALAFFFVTVR